MENEAINYRLIERYLRTTCVPLIIHVFELYFPTYFTFYDLNFICLFDSNFGLRARNIYCNKSSNRNERRMRNLIIVNLLKLNSKRKETSIRRFVQLFYNKSNV